MTQQIIEFGDLEALLVPYMAAKLTTWGPLVDRKFPPTVWAPGYALVIRDDGGPDQSIVTGLRRVGFTCIGPDGKHQQTKQFAERVASAARALPGSSVPVANVTVNGPYSLEATNRVEFYLTAELVVVGHTITL